MSVPKIFNEKLGELLNRELSPEVETIDYAENPDKKFLDEDLGAVLRYVENDKKTDQTMSVYGINCPTQTLFGLVSTARNTLPGVASLSGQRTMLTNCTGPNNPEGSAAFSSRLAGVFVMVSFSVLVPSCKALVISKR